MRLRADDRADGKRARTHNSKGHGLRSLASVGSDEICGYRKPSHPFTVMKQHVFKRSRTVNGKSVKAKTYTGRYRFTADLLDTEVKLGVTDKQVAQSKLAAIVKQAEMEQQGLAAPQRQVETVSMPLKVVVREWIADLSAKGRKPHYCGIMEQFMGVFMRDCQWATVADIQPDTFIRWRGANRGKSPKTLNEYLGCVRAFLNWLIKSGRLPSNPLACVEKVETRGREVRNRLSYTHEEFLGLVAAGGPDRGVVYAMAYYTGLRRAELASLCWGDFDLAAGSVTILAEHAKNKTRVSLPLHPDLQAMLVRYFEACGSPGHSVKALKVSPRLLAFDRDLATAGIVKYDERGRVADFHSLRHSTATRLASQDVPLPVAMRLMRHSDPKLTAKAYVDQAALPLMESISKMPGMSNGNSLSPVSSLESVVSGHFESQPVATEEPKPSLQATLNESLSRLLSHLGATCQMAPAVGIEPTT